jgi:hypothetical protein
MYINTNKTGNPYETSGRKDAEIVAKHGAKNMKTCNWTK